MGVFIHCDVAAVQSVAPMRESAGAKKGGGIGGNLHIHTQVRGNRNSEWTYGAQKWRHVARRRTVNQSF